MSWLSNEELSREPNDRGEPGDRLEEACGLSGNGAQAQWDRALLVRLISFSSRLGPQDYSWTVPVGVATITVNAYGGQGAGGEALEFAPRGGKGAHVHAKLTVDPGQRLVVHVPNLIGGSCSSEGGGGEAALVVGSGADLVVAGGGGGSAVGLSPKVIEPEGPKPIEGGAGGTSPSCKVCTRAWPAYRSPTERRGTTALHGSTGHLYGVAKKYCLSHTS